MLIFSFPEPAPAEADIPVAEVFVEKVFHEAAGYGGLVVVEAGGYFGYQCVERRKNPAIDLRSICGRDIGLFKGKSIHVGVEDEELVGII